MVWHLDVGLSFPKSVGSLIGGSAHPMYTYIHYSYFGHKTPVGWFLRIIWPVGTFIGAVGMLYHWSAIGLFVTYQKTQEHL